MGDQLLEEVRADLHLADAGLGLRVGDPKVRAARRMQPQVAEAYVAELATRTPDPPSVAIIARRPM